mgnify:FL=1
MMKTYFVLFSFCSAKSSDFPHRYLAVNLLQAGHSSKCEISASNDSHLWADQICSANIHFADKTLLRFSTGLGLLRSLDPRASRNLLFYKWTLYQPSCDRNNFCLTQYNLFVASKLVLIQTKLSYSCFCKKTILYTANLRIARKDAVLLCVLLAS